MRTITLPMLSALVLVTIANSQPPQRDGRAPGGRPPGQRGAPPPKFEYPGAVMIRLVAPLDEPEFYCVDIPGYGPGVQLDSPLTGHTLKAFGSADEMWVMDHPKKGQIYAPAYKLCIQAQRAKAGASLMLKPPASPFTAGSSDSRS